MREYTYSIPDSFHVQPGMRVTVNFANRVTTALVVRLHDQKPKDFDVKPLIKVIDETPLLSEDLLDLGKKVALYSFCSWGEMLFTMIPSAKIEKESLFFTDDQPDKEVVLTEQQQKASDAILHSERACYLFGITGSGKTEVFLDVIEKILAAGKSVIYLVPEISLSYQTIQIVSRRFPECSLIHSAVTPSQRLKQWRQMQKGESRIVVGTRSAIFAPVPNLGLIIIDEEHDGSYKSGSTPRFHARQVAMIRQKMSGATLVMGSATPSTEAYHAMKTGEFKRIDLNKRVAGGQLPQFEIVDMRREKGIFSQRLIDEVLKTKAMGRQSILFLNRKGYARYYSCPDCGFQLMCRQCSIAMTYHKKEEILLCHYCGSQEKPPMQCPECGSFNAGYAAFGLEKIEQEAMRLFSGLNIIRLDGDAAKQKDEARRLIETFSKGEADLLLATQMAAKGFNFPHLRFVAITLADVGLSLPDFRAEEKTFALLSQIAGRAGRYNNDGLVIAQTHRPENYAIKCVKDHAVEQFYEHELQMRQISGFPPYSRLIKIAFRSKNEQKAMQASESFASEITSFLSGQTDILGPAPAPIKKTAGVFRYQILLRTEHYALLRRELAAYLEETASPSGVYREIDHDPVSLL